MCIITTQWNCSLPSSSYPTIYLREISVFGPDSHMPLSLRYRMAAVPDFLLSGCICNHIGCDRIEHECISHCCSEIKGNHMPSSHSKLILMHFLHSSSISAQSTGSHWVPKVGVWLHGCPNS